MRTLTISVPTMAASCYDEIPAARVPISIDAAIKSAMTWESRAKNDWKRCRIMRAGCWAMAAAFWDLAPNHMRGNSARTMAHHALRGL